MSGIKMLRLVCKYFELMGRPILKPCQQHTRIALDAAATPQAAARRMETTLDVLLAEPTLREDITYVAATLSSFTLTLTDFEAAAPSNTTLAMVFLTACSPHRTKLSANSSNSFRCFLPWSPSSSPQSRETLRHFP